MTENPAEEEAIPTPPDTWQRLTLDWMLWAVDALGDSPHPEERGQQYDALCERQMMLEEAADEHPPVFHVRKLRKRWPKVDHEVRSGPRPPEWDWVAIHPNGNKLYGSTESYEHKSHAIDQARSVASALGAELVIDGEGE